MVRTSSNSRDILAQKAAYLKAKHRMSQEEIGKILGEISQAHVSRLLKRAEQMGWLITEHHFIEKGISEQTLEEIHHLLVSPALSDAVRKIGNGADLPQIRVFDSGTNSPTPQAMDQRRKRFGRVAAGRLLEIFNKSSVVGISWGRCVNNLIQGLDNTNPFSREKSPIQFVPTCAELISLAMPEYSSTRLADRLNDVINNGKGTRLSLSGVPAYIPRRYKKEQAQTIRQYINDISSYKKIFHGRDAIIEKMDTMITSIGSPTLPVGGCISDLQDACDIKTKRLQSLIVGDIGGVLIPQPGLNKAGRELVKELNKAWTGISYSHLEHNAEMAKQNPKRPGNIIVAIGQDKAPALIEIIRLGLANELMIDKDLENTLIRSVNA